MKRSAMTLPELILMKYLAQKTKWSGFKRK